MAGRWDTVTVDGGSMRCYVNAPAGDGPFPAVVVAQHAGGVDEFIQTMTDRLADAGYVGIAPELYHREDPNSSDNAIVMMTRLRDPNIVQDMNAAVAHLKTLSEADGDRIGVTGFCMGGRVAYLMASHDPELKAAVVFYAGNTMMPWGEGPTPFDRTDQIGCPVMGLVGKDDANPNPDDVAKLDAELSRLDKAHEFHSYAGAGHGFMGEGSPSYHREAAEDAWPKCVGWFDRYVK